MSSAAFYEVQWHLVFAEIWGRWNTKRSYDHLKQEFSNFVGAEELSSRGDREAWKGQSSGGVSCWELQEPPSPPEHPLGHVGREEAWELSRSGTTGWGLRVKYNCGHLPVLHGLDIVKQRQKNHGHCHRQETGRSSAGFFCLVCLSEVREAGRVWPFSPSSWEECSWNQWGLSTRLAFGGCCARCWVRGWQTGGAIWWLALVRAGIWSSALQFSELDVVRVPSLRSHQHLDAPNTDLEHNLYNNNNRIRILIANILCNHLPWVR